MLIDKIFAFIFGMAFMVACTYSITQVHTEGTASDVVDETQSNTPEVSPTIDLPINP